MLELNGLQEKAERCFRLARAIDAQDVVSTLVELGRQYEQKARRIEAAQAQERGWTRFQTEKLPTIE